MTTHIKNAEYRRFWEARYEHHATQNYARTIEPFERADKDCRGWASRFADPDTLADIEANAMKRGQG